MVARVYGAPRAAGPWSGFVCVVSHAPNENAFVLRRVRHRAPRALTLRLLRPLGVVVIRLSVGCIMMPEVGSSLRLLAKLARAAGRAARARAVGAGERAPPARVSGRAVTRWRRSGARRHAGAVERAVRARGERREPPRFGACEQPRGSTSEAARGDGGGSGAVVERGDRASARRSERGSSERDRDRSAARARAWSRGTSASRRRAASARGQLACAVFRRSQRGRYAPTTRHRHEQTEKEEAVAARAGS